MANGEIKNVSFSVEGEILVVKVDLSKRFGFSKSGKNQTIATTAGIVDVPQRPSIKIGLNIFTK